MLKQRMAQLVKGLAYLVPPVHWILSLRPTSFRLNWQAKGAKQERPQNMAVWQSRNHSGGTWQRHSTWSSTQGRSFARREQLAPSAKSVPPIQAKFHWLLVWPISKIAKHSWMVQMHMRMSRPEKPRCKNHMTPSRPHTTAHDQNGRLLTSIVSCLT